MKNFINHFNLKTILFLCLFLICSCYVNAQIKVDANGSYLPRPHIDLWGLESVVNLHPDCPSNQNVTLSNITIADRDGELIQSGNNLTISNFIIENGGGAVIRAYNEITISSNFEFEVGGEVLIVSQLCSN